MSDTNELRTYLQRHPKTLAALFGLMVLLAETGTVAAGACGVIRGP